MKKIKGLLLFGILTLLGIGSSFGVFFELNDLTGSQLVIPNYSVGNESSIATYSLGDSVYYTTEIDYYENSSLITLSSCSDSSNLINGFGMAGYAGTNLNFKFGNFSNCSFNSLSNFDYIYLSNSLPISPYSTKSSGNITSYIYFDNNYVNTNYGSVRDIPVGYTRQKLFLNSVGNYGIFSTDSSGDYLFTSIGRDSFNIEDLGEGLYNFDLDVYSGILELHYNDYSLPYYSGSCTIILSLGSGVVYFNYYTGYYYGIKEIQDGVLPLYKGYLTYNNSSSEGYTQFINFLNNGHKIVLSKAGGNNGISFVSYGYYYFTQTNLGGGYFTTTSNLTLNYEIDNSVPTFITLSGNGNQSTGSINSNSLYYNCLGPTYNTPDGLPPKYCFDSSGNFQGDFLKNCYLSFDGLNQYVYCYNDGFQQEVEFIENGSGYDIVACDGCSTNVLDWLNDGYSTGYFENFLNTTGYFFRCPFPYSESLTVWPKLISMMNGFDINLPINCAFAGYSQGKQVFTFEHSGHLIQGGPLLNFEGNNRKLLYTFFDILIILGLLFFFGKILKFFS